MSSDAQSSPHNKLAINKQHQQDRLSPHQAACPSSPVGARRRRSGFFMGHDFQMPSLAGQSQRLGLNRAAGLASQQPAAFERAHPRQAASVSPSPSPSPSASSSSKRRLLLRQHMQGEQERSQSADSQTDASLDAGSCSSPAAKTGGPHHVGPVMGIFFKVWSLVKVTKGRGNKMRRQNSEDASQFHYISGDQFGATADQARPRAADRDQMRRAGSQPPERQALETLALEALERRLHPGAGTPPAPLGQHQQQQQQQQPPQLSHAKTATSGSGSSSGVSSGHSSAGSGGPSSGTPPSGADHAKRQLTSNGGSHDEPPTGGRPAASAEIAIGRLKRSATSSFNYHQRHQGRAAASFRFRRNNSSAASDDEPDRPALAPLIIDQSDQMDQLSSAGEPQDEDDSNEIYSTPNDSIHSIRGSGLFLPPASSTSTTTTTTTSTTTTTTTNTNASTTNSKHQDHAQPPKQGAAFPTIVKSFSVNSFGLLTGRAPASQARFGPIDETLADQSFRAALPGPLTACASSIASPQDQHLKLGARRRDGSRFFISSSSSEDSAKGPPSQSQHQLPPRLLDRGSPDGAPTTSTGHDNDQKDLKQEASRAQQARVQMQMQLSQGVHYHAPPTRPVSLLVGAASGVAPSGFFLPIFTPTGARPPVGAPPLIPSSIALSPGATGLLVDSNALAATASAAPPPLPLTEPPPGRPQLGALQLAAARALYHGAGAPPATGCGAAYRRSPSLFELANGTRLGAGRLVELAGAQAQCAAQDTAAAAPQPGPREPTGPSSLASQMRAAQLQMASRPHLPHSISLHDCKLPSANRRHLSPQHSLPMSSESSESDYKLAQMLLQLGSRGDARDADGNTALMHAVFSDNLAALKCLLERGVNLAETNKAGASILDIVCAGPTTQVRLEMLKLLIDAGANLDRARPSDGTRLLDRLISEHQALGPDKLPLIDCLLQNGAKLGSSTWNAARDKADVQLRLLRKLCQDGYYLYKSSAIEEGVYRFEYSLRRLAELEQQLSNKFQHHPGSRFHAASYDPSHQLAPIAAKQIRYQTYLGLSRCERRRKFYKRALEFAHLAILVDSTAYEGFYSKAQILKDIGEFDDALIAIDQTARLVDRSVETIEFELKDLRQQEEALIFDGCFKALDSDYIESARVELRSNLDYLNEARKHIDKMRIEILENRDSICHPESSRALGDNPIAT